MKASTLVAALAAASLVSLGGCGNALVREDWHAAASLPPLEPVYVEVTPAELASVCGDYPGMYLHGCARRDYGAQICTIFTAPHPAEWLLEHERLHCAGWDHGNPRTFKG